MNDKEKIRATYHNLVFSNLTVEQVSKLPEWLLENIEDNMTTVTEQLLSMLTEARIDEVRKACQDNWQKPIPEQYMLDRLNQLKRNKNGDSNDTE